METVSEFGRGSTYWCAFCQLAAGFVKYYETLDLRQLEIRCIRLRFPLTATRVVMAAYSSARCMALDGLLATAVSALSGAIAGCSLITTMTRVNSIEASDAIEWPLATDFNV